MISRLPDEIRVLSVDDRLRLAEQIWDSVVDDQAQFELTSAQKSELERRLALREQRPDSSSAWPVVKARISNAE
jgi:putative addiction module component (TIGR02574 family)